MSKIIALFFAAVALVQWIKPLGYPGLEHRRDAWKLAVIGFFLSVLSIPLLASLQ